MKRTPMPPRKTAIRRKPRKAIGRKPGHVAVRRLRHRSKTNSKKHENRAAWTNYRKEHFGCEILHLFPRCGGSIVIPNCENSIEKLSAWHGCAYEIHHLAGFLNGSPRHDVPANMISLCRQSHAFVERWTHDGICLCLWAKHLAGALDIVKLDEITGLSVLGKIENAKCTFPFAASCRERLLEGMEQS